MIYVINWQAVGIDLQCFISNGSLGANYSVKSTSRSYDSGDELN